LTTGDLLHSGGSRLRVCAVSYLNTVPLIRGFTHGPQRELFDLTVDVPSVLADRLKAGQVDIGLLPCAELERLRVDHLDDVGIACRGAVRSILLVSRVEPARIRTLALDASSRSSVMLTRILLAERYGARPELVTMQPELESMLARADAALLIGDPALRLDASVLPYRVLDLGAEWMNLTGLPMVFAVWAGPRRHLIPSVAEAFLASFRYGAAQLEEIVREAPMLHGVSEDLARTYLTDHIKFELNADDRKGLALYRAKVSAMRALDLAPVQG
jgi:predicted solute-binding protein